MTHDPARSQPQALERGPSGKKVWVIVGVLSLVALLGALFVRTRPEPVSAPRKERPPPAVRVESAQLASVPVVEEYRGELAANAAELAAQGSGRLLEVRVNLGDRFEQGDVLALIDAAETRRTLTEAEAQVRAAEAAKARTRAELRAAELDLERAERLLAEQVVSEQETTTLRSRVSVLTAELASVDAQREAARARVGLFGEQLSQSKLKAPFSGAVAERHLDPGATVQPGTPVLRLIQGGPLKVRFRASERHSPKLTAGAPFTLTTLATGETQHAGKIERISAEVSRADRTIAVEGVLAGEVPELRAGMYATVSVELGTLTDATLVPAQAVSEQLDNPDDPTQFVWVVEDGNARKQRVTLLGRHRDQVAVSPLPPTATVVVFGQQLLSDGMRVEAVPRSAP